MKKHYLNQIKGESNRIRKELETYKYVNTNQISKYFLTSSILFNVCPSADIASNLNL